MRNPKFSIPNNLVLAPIAGYSDVGLRTLSYKYGAGLCYTEMVSAKGLYYGSRGSETLLYLGEEEKNRTGVQLFGEDAAIIAEVAASKAIEPFKYIDVNMGCPVPKVVKNGEGSALLKTPSKAYDIISAIRKSVGDDRIVSAKLRLGFEKDSFYALDVARAVEDAGADIVYLHGRRREDYFSGEIDYDGIATVKAGVSIPVYGNGNVFDKASYEKMLSTGVDGVMIGRGALGHPWIFEEVLGIERDHSVRETVLYHISKLLEILPENVVANNMKSVLSLYVKGLPDVKARRRRIFDSKSLDDIYAITEELK